MPIVAIPPATTRRHRPDEPRDDARLEGAELVRGADEDHLDGRHPPAELVRRDQRDRRRADVDADHVHEPGDREGREREREPLATVRRRSCTRRRARRRRAASARRTCAAADASASARRAARRPPARSAGRPSPTGPTCRIERAKTGASAIAPPNRTAKRSSRIAPSTIRRPAQEADAFDHGPASRARRCRQRAPPAACPARARSRGRPEQPGRQRVEELRRDLENDAADGRPATTAICQPTDRSAIAPAIISVGTVSGAARAAPAPRSPPPAARGGEHEVRPERPRRPDRHREQQQRDRDSITSDTAMIGPARHDVCELSRRQREQEQRHELDEADQPEVERVAVDRVDLPADRDEDHLLARPGDDVRRPEEREIALPQRRRQPLAAPAKLPTAPVRLRPVTDTGHGTAGQARAPRQASRRGAPRRHGPRRREASRAGEAAGARAAAEAPRPGLVRRARPLRPPPRGRLRDARAAAVGRRGRHRLRNDLRPQGLRLLAGLHGLRRRRCPRSSPRRSAR